MAAEGIAAGVSDVDKMFSRGRLLASKVGNQYRGDDNPTIVARCKHFSNLVQKYEKDVSIQYWVSQGRGIRMRIGGSGIPYIDLRVGVLC